MAETPERVGTPQGLINFIRNVCLQGTQELIQHRRIALIQATAGFAMVRANILFVGKLAQALADIAGIQMPASV